VCSVSNDSMLTRRATTPRAKRCADRALAREPKRRRRRQRAPEISPDPPGLTLLEMPVDVWACAARFLFLSELAVVCGTCSALRHLRLLRDAYESVEFCGSSMGALSAWVPRGSHARSLLHVLPDSLNFPARAGAQLPHLESWGVAWRDSPSSDEEEDEEEGGGPAARVPMPRPGELSGLRVLPALRNVSIQIEASSVKRADRFCYPYELALQHRDGLGLRLAMRNSPVSTRHVRFRLARALPRLERLLLVGLQPEEEDFLGFAKLRRLKCLCLARPQTRYPPGLDATRDLARLEGLAGLEYLSLSARDFVDLGGDSAEPPLAHAARLKVFAAALCLALRKLCALRFFRLTDGTVPLCALVCAGMRAAKGGAVRVAVAPHVCPTEPPDPVNNRVVEAHLLWTASVADTLPEGDGFGRFVDLIPWGR